MSHSIEYGIYKEDVNKKKVQADWDNFVRIADREEGASGLPGAIRWNDGVTPLDSKSDAERWIDEHDGGWYDQIAVRFYDVDHVKSGYSSNKRGENICHIQITTRFMRLTTRIR